MPPKIPPALAFLSEDQCWECEQSYGDFDQDTPFDDPGFQNVIEYARKMWTALSQIFIPYNLHALDCLGEKPRFLERLVYGYVASDSAGDTVMVSQQSEGPPAWERTWQDVQILAWVAYAIRLLQHALVPGCKNNEFASGVNRSQSRRCKSGKP